MLIVFNMGIAEAERVNFSAGVIAASRTGQHHLCDPMTRGGKRRKL
jgi:hypothetical protein